MKFWKNFKLYILVIALITIFLATFILLKKYVDSSEDTTEASSANSTITTKANWDAGTLDNIDTVTTEGSFEIDDKAESALDTSGMTATSPEPIDGNISTYYGAGFGASISWQIDFGEEHYIYRVLTKKPDTYPGAIAFSHSTDGSSWTSQGFSWQPASGGVITGIATINTSVRYLKVEGGPPTPGDGWRIYELEFYTTARAIHTTGATQVDGGENFWSWDANTITQTVPANTSATYQYRTSSNGSDWTAWVGDIGSVTNRTGDDDNNPTRYRYLQIKATLTNTDGASTPTIDSYDIDYHTEVKPGAPTAQTAVVQ